jgi:hypothetical protein
LESICVTSLLYAPAPDELERSGHRLFMMCVLQPIWQVAETYSMKRLIAIAGTLLLTTAFGYTQSLEDLNVQIHGYATQGLIYTTQNNWNTTDSSNTSAEWTEAVINVTARPSPKLRVGMQTRYFLLGEYGNQIILDWAEADYKADERFGVRFGKVKTPRSLINEIQDIDPAYLWALLPSGTYPLASRNPELSHYGAVVYGTFALGEALGKVQYDAWGGDRVVAADDGYLRPVKDLGIGVPSGPSGATYGGALRWYLPIRGAMVGVSETHNTLNGPLTSGFVPGTLSLPNVETPYFFGQYEHKRYVISGEYSRETYTATAAFPGAPALIVPEDDRVWYAAATYKLSERLMVGTYHSSIFDLQDPLGPSRYQKDWVFSSRYDFNSFLYAKAEEHFLEGTHVGYSTSDNPNGLKPNAKMTLIKLGVSF